VFIKGRSCLTNLISCYDEVTHLVDERKAVDVIYPDFGKAFYTVSHSIIVEKWFEWLHAWLGKKQSGWLSPESSGEWS